MTAGLREQAFNVTQSWPGILKSLLMVFQPIDVKQGKAPLGVCNCKIKICKYVICLPTEHQGVDELLQKYLCIPGSNWNLEILVILCTRVKTHVVEIWSHVACKEQ